jgi:amino acid transporter
LSESLDCHYVDCDHRLNSRFGRQTDGAERIVKRTSLRRVLLGNRLQTSAESEQRLSAWQALAVFSSDALSSVAYATEEILLVLILAGPAALSLAWPLSLAIACLLAIVAVSYYQTILGYPSGGGAYIVAHENLGISAGLVAAAALLVDYVLTVAVSITA